MPPLFTHVCGCIALTLASLVQRWRRLRQRAGVEAKLGPRHDQHVDAHGSDRLGQHQCRGRRREQAERGGDGHVDDRRRAVGRARALQLDTARAPALPGPRLLLSKALGSGVS